MRLPELVQPRQEPADFEELWTGGVRWIQLLARADRVASGPGMAAWPVELGDQPSSLRAPGSRRRVAGLGQEVEERRLERDGERALRADELEAARRGLHPVDPETGPAG